MIPASVREAQRQRKAMRRYLAARKRAQQAFNVEHAHRHVEQIGGRV